MKSKRLRKHFLTEYQAKKDLMATIPDYQEAAIVVFEHERQQGETIDDSYNYTVNLLTATLATND